MAADFSCLYPRSRGEAIFLRELEKWDESFYLNVSCARNIEQSIRGHFHDDDLDGDLQEGCANEVLKRYGFKRVNFVLANSLNQMGCPYLLSDEVRSWDKQIYIPDDGKYNRYFMADTSALLLEAFICQARDAYQALGLFGPEHCAADPQEQDYKDRVLVMRPDTLRESFWDPRNQLWLGEGGFGCSPGARGTAVYATCLGDGEETCWNRDDFIGVLDEQYLPDWAAEKLEELRGPRQEQQSGPVMGGITMN